MAKERLQTKLYKYLITFSAVILLILWLLQSVFLSDMYKFVRAYELDKSMEYFSEEIKYRDVEEVVDEVENGYGVVVRPSKDYKRPKIDDKGRRQIPPEAIEKAADFTIKGRDESFTFYALITPLDSTISTLKLQLFIVSLIVIVLSLILARIISKNIARPIENINKSAKDLAQGNFDVRFKADDYLEIEELSDTLNYTSDELGKVDTYRRELLANISHDLKTPLSIINSYTQMMKDFKDEITDENLDMILEETDRLSNLVTDALEISNLNSKTYNLNKKPYDLSSQTESVVKRLAEMLDGDNIHINTSLEENLMVLADEIKTEQVIYNLIINAVTHSKDSKEILVVTKKENGKAKFSVTDYGEGIAPEDIKNIWERYYKVDKTHTRNKHGSGLGLSIVKEIMNLHGGSYGVNSIPNEETTFYIILDLAHPED